MTRFLAVPTAPAPWPFFDNPDRACRTVADPQVFFPTVGGSARPAKQICARCPVKDDCREWALLYELAGVWGGMSAEERADERQRQAGTEQRTCEVCGQPYVPRSAYQRACGSACARYLTKERRP